MHVSWNFCSSFQCSFYRCHDARGENPQKKKTTLVGTSLSKLAWQKRPVHQLVSIFMLKGGLFSTFVPSLTNFLIFDSLKTSTSRNRSELRGSECKNESMNRGNVNSSSSYETLESGFVSWNPLTTLLVFVKLHMEHVWPETLRWMILCHLLYPCVPFPKADESNSWNPM